MLNNLFTDHRLCDQKIVSEEVLGFILNKVSNMRAFFNMLCDVQSFVPSHFLVFDYEEAVTVSLNLHLIADVTV